MSWSALRLSLTVTGRMHVKSDELSESRTTAHPSLPVLLRRSLFPSTSRVLKCVFFLQLKPSRHTFYFEFHRGKTDGREETLCVCLYICANEILQSKGWNVRGPISTQRALAMYERALRPSRVWAWQTTSILTYIHNHIYRKHTLVSQVSQDLIHAADWKHPKLVYCIFQSCLIRFFHYKSPPCMCDVSISRCSLSD